MTANMLRALPGMLAFVSLLLVVTLDHPTYWIVIALLAYIYSTVSVGAEADYWRKRSREFYVAQQNMVDAGIVRWDDPILRSGRLK